jgi:Phosphotransferase enzyme family
MPSGQRVCKSFEGRKEKPGLAKLVGTSVELIKINATSLESRGNRRTWVKRRSLGSGLIAVVANLFLILARAPVHLWISRKKWQSWEITCYRLLYECDFSAFPEGRWTVCVDEVPGKSLLDCANDGRLTLREIEAAAKELRRVHALWCQELNNYWSHGDANLNNLIYDDQTNRVQLIDFELIHLNSLSAIERHADDIVVFLQDLMARVSAEQWLRFAVGFINAYDRPAVTEEARRRLVVPTGYAVLWWKRRTDCLMELEELVERIRSLEAALDPRPLPLGRVKDPHGGLNQVVESSFDSTRTFGSPSK